jgi:ankyrin repeat protein
MATGISSRIIDLLLSNGADAEDKNSRGDTPLHCAAKSGNIENINFLIDYGVNINSINNALNTPLHEASNNNKAVSLFIEKGANVKARNEKGETPLHLANCAEAIKLLILKFPNIVNFTDKNGNLAIHKAVSKHNAPVVKILRELGSSDSTRNNDGLTPRCLASSRGVKDALEYESSISVEEEGA